MKYLFKISGVIAVTALVAPYVAVATPFLVGYGVYAAIFDNEKKRKIKEIEKEIDGLYQAIFEKRKQIEEIRKTL